MKNLKLTKEQLNTLAQYFSDISKLIVGSAVIGFSIPTGGSVVSIPLFISGIIVAAEFLILSINMVE